MQSRMEMTFLCSNGDGLKTDVGAIFDNNAETYAAFLFAARLGVAIDDAEFLLDYYNREGDLSDTIGLTRAGFERITGNQAKSEEAYRAIDRDFWRCAEERMRQHG